MRICIPVSEDRGLDSPVHGHFGSAPLFLFHDTVKGETLCLENGNTHHAHGLCRPADAMAGQAVEAIIVAGAGRRAVDGLNQMGIRVYLSMEGDARKNVEALAAGSLGELKPENACGHHGQGGGCGDGSHGKSGR